MDQSINRLLLKHIKFYTSRFR